MGRTEWHEQTVTVLLDKDGTAYKRAVAVAAQRGISVESVISSALMMHGEMALRRWLDRENRGK